MRDLPRYPRAMQFGVVMGTLADFFEREGMRYALIGGLAVHA
jgi:hypothetical protein